MSYQKHAKLVMEGRLTSGLGPDEIWSCGIALSHDAGDEWLPDLDDYIGQIYAPLATWFHAADTGIATTATLDRIKVNNIETSGLYHELTTHEHTYSTPILGAAAATAPSFCSAVTTWETGAARGYAHRGRIYLPNYTWTAYGSYMASGTQDNITAAGKALLSVLLRNSPDPSGPLIAPFVVSKHGTGVSRLITAVSADNVWDHQARRKNRLPGIRHTSNWP